VSLEQIPIAMPSWRDLLEFLIVAAVLYKVLKFLAATRALQILFGVLILGAIYIAAFLLNLSMITYLLGVVFTYGAFAALVVFQPELRFALARLGQTRPFTFFSGRAASVVAEQVSEAVERLSRNATGAIIAVEREVALEEYLDSGTRLQAALSADLVATIFSPYSPLHDGAVVVRGDQIIGAGCILPLTQHAPPSKALGTRHRAALGLSEETDAIVFVVSEETSAISVAQRGSLEQGIIPERVRELLAAPAARV
jgi:diadenylate cyclase